MERKRKKKERWGLDERLTTFQNSEQPDEEGCPETAGEDFDTPGKEHLDHHANNALKEEWTDGRKEQNLIKQGKGTGGRRYVQSLRGL